jgi:glycosyltransferase involved in cell wall biosynthesis
MFLYDARETNFLEWFTETPEEIAQRNAEDQELVTVVIPAFNAEKTVARTIDSVLDQVGCKLEVIVVDDGSTDSTPSILAGYGTKIRVLRQEGRGVHGLGITRNIGAALGSGLWIAFADSDDWWHPCKIISQLAAARKAGADVVFANARNVGSASVGETAYSSERRPAGAVLDLLISDNFIFTSSVLVRRPAFEACAGFTDQEWIVQDWDLWLRLAAQGRRFVGVTSPLIEYAWTPNSTSKSHYSMRRRRLGAFERCIKSINYSPIKKNLARSNLEATSAWFLSQDKPGQAIWWYLRALAYNPLNVSAAKGVVKSGLSAVKALSS